MRTLSLLVLLLASANTAAATPKTPPLPEPLPAPLETIVTTEYIVVKSFATTNTQPSKLEENKVYLPFYIKKVEKVTNNP